MPVSRVRKAYFFHAATRNANTKIAVVNLFKNGEKSTFFNRTKKSLNAVCQLLRSGRQLYTCSE